MLTKTTDHIALTRPYMTLVTACGVGACLYSVLGLPYGGLDLNFFVLAGITIFVGSRIGIAFSSHQIQITVSDTLVFLTLLLYGGEAAVLVAGLEALYSSLRFSKLWSTRFFNTGLLAFSTFTAYQVIYLVFGSPVSLTHAELSPVFVSAVAVMALVQYVTNSSLAAVRESLKFRRPPVATWKDHFLWTSVTYFAGAAAAAVTAKLIVGNGFYALAAALPVIAIIYFSYRMYRKELDTKTAQIEQAARHAEEQKTIAEALRASEEHFRSAFDYAAVGMALVSTEGKWLSVNPSLCSLLHYSEEKLLSLDLQTVVHADEIGDTLSSMYKVAEGHGAVQASEWRFVTKEGKIVWTTVSLSRVVDSAGKTMHFILQAQDITERKKAEERLHVAAYYDPLTGLPNRTLFTEHLELAVKRTADHPNHLVAVLFLDLDRFKNITDSLGHAIGDKLLKSVAGRLSGAFRPSDSVARFGGDEFAVLLNGVGSSKEVIEIGERIVKAIEQPYRLSGYEVVTSCSIGVTLSTVGYDRPEDFLRDADTAMYRAKEQGKGRLEVFDKYMHARAVSRLKLENDLRHAVERGEFEVYYQPVLELETGRLSGFEALIRWNHPERGQVSPTEFITVAEDTDLIIPMGEWILREACRQVYEWQMVYQTPEPLTLSVNLSGKQFKQADLVERIKAILFQTRLAPECLRLEITESVVMDDAEAAIAMLRQLRSIGIQLSIDDFGTGYSSFSYLHRFPVNILKIDRSFVSRMSEDEESQGIVEMIITLASKLKMDVVAEGIETVEQLAALNAFRCKYGQGYYFARPLDSASTAMFILQRCTGETQKVIDAGQRLDELLTSYQM